jgi:hypothetical protein
MKVNHLFFISLFLIAFFGSAVLVELLHLNPQAYAYQFSFQAPDKIGYTEVDLLITGDSTAQFNLDPKVFSDRAVTNAYIAAPSYLINRELIKNINKFRVKPHVIYMYSFNPDHYEKNIDQMAITSRAITLVEYLELQENKLTNNTFGKAKATIKYFFIWVGLSQITIERLFNWFKELLLSPIKDVEKDEISYEDLILKNRGHYPSKHKSTLVDVRKNEVKDFCKRFILSNQDISAMKTLSSWSLANNISISIALPPLMSWLDDNNCKKYYSSVENIFKGLSHSNFKLIYINSDNFKFKIDDYADLNHLNSDAAIVFSMIIKDKLKKEFNEVY